MYDEFIEENDIAAKYQKIEEKGREYFEAIVKKYNPMITDEELTALTYKDLLEIENFKSDNVIHSKNIAKCAYNKFKNNNTKTADTIMPLYLRKSQAERMKQKNG